MAKNLYHGTNISILNIDTSLCEGYKDFGKGFYTTTNKSQAERWARKKKESAIAYNKKMNNRKIIQGRVYGYIFDMDLAISDPNIEYYIFKEANIDWVKFILENRQLEMHKHNYDLVIGPIADSNAIPLIEEFYEYTNNISFLPTLDDYRKLISNLHPENLGIQYFFAHKLYGINNALKYLKRDVRINEVY